MKMGMKVVIMMIIVSCRTSKKCFTWHIVTCTILTTYMHVLYILFSLVASTAVMTSNVSGDDSRLVGKPYRQQPGPRPRINDNRGSNKVSDNIMAHVISTKLHVRLWAHAVQTNIWNLLLKHCKEPPQMKRTVFVVRRQKVG